MRRRQRQAMIAGLAGLCLWTLAGPGWAEESRTIRRPAEILPMVAQAESASSGLGPSQAQTVLPPGGTTVEDLLLQKGSITMDEWIQIRAEQEYSGAESARRIDAIEDWKSARTEKQ